MFKKANIKEGLTLESPDMDFIPYACHYSPQLMLTKNGELMGVLKITGFMKEQVGATHQDVREVLREAIEKYIPDSSYALWVHTIRRKRNVSLSSASYNSYSQKVNTAWEKKHQWKQAYVNEIYLSVIKDSASLKVKNIKDVIRSLSFSQLTKWHSGYLTTSAKELESVIGNIKKELEVFGVKRLGLINYKNNYYSELLQFFSKILNLADTPVPLEPVNVSQKLASYKIAFGFNVMEVVSAVGKRFASLFTLKEYHELNLEMLDKFLQIPQEFIITQTLDFIHSERALEHFRKQARVLEASRDETFYEVSGLKNIIESAKTKRNAFGESQMTIMLLHSDVQALESDIDYAYKTLSELGINATRRDLRMEECYWANLPANFAYATRRKPLNTNRFAGLISLSTDSAGNKDGNKWGEAVTIFKTAARTPYFFNFHQGETGHTAIMGPKNSGKEKLLHFLLAESMKFDPHIYYIGKSSKMRSFIEALGGKYTQLSAENGGETPFSLKPSPQALLFFYQWLVRLMGKHEAQLEAKEKKILQQAAKFLLKLPPKERSVARLLPALEKSGLKNIHSIFAAWVKDETRAKWIQKSTIDLTKERVHGIDISQVADDLTLLAPTLSSILFKIEIELTGQPSIIVFEEAWETLNNPVFMPKLSEMIERFGRKNAIFVFSTENVDNVNKNPIPQTVVSKIVTKIFTPNRDADKYSKSYKDAWALNDSEFNKLLEMQGGLQQCMLKIENQAVVLNTDFSGIDL